MNRQKEGSLLPRLSVRRPVTVLMVFLALLVVGYIAYSRIPLEMMPTGYELPLIAVWVPYPNATPEEIEKLIVKPIEDVLGTVNNVKSTSAEAGANSAWIMIQFDQDTDLDVAYAEVRDRMERVKKDLPDDVERINIRRFRMNDDADLWYALEVNRQFPDLHYLLDLNVAKKIQRIDGVANVDIHGAEEKSFEIRLDLEELTAGGINVQDLMVRLSSLNFTIPSGDVRTGERRFYVRSTGRYNSVEEMGEIQVSPDRKLKDIAAIRFDVPERESIERINGEKGVFIGVVKESGANSVELYQKVAALVEREFEQNPALRGIAPHLVFSQGELIVMSIADLQETAMWAALFAVLVLFFFIRHMRMTLLITMAIPISLLTTLVIMYFTGETLNLLSMMGLMVSVGLVVDNSIVVVENIFRHRKAGDDPKRGAIKGASEVGLAVVMATLTTMVVFLPMILMSGSMMSFIMGRIGFPVVYALGSSLLVALVFIPLTTTFIKDRGKIGSSKIIDWARGLYVRVLGWAIKHRVEMVVLSLAVVVSIIIFTSDLGYQSEMSGSINTPIRMRLGKRYVDPAGWPDQLARRVEQWCFDHRERLGFSLLNTRVQKDFVQVRLFRDLERSTTPLMEKPVLWLQNMLRMHDMQKDPEQERRQFIRENLAKDLNLLEDEAEIFIGWGGGNDDNRASVQLVLEGPDYRDLREWGEMVRDELKGLPGIINVESEIEESRKQLEIVINREEAKKRGIDTSTAARYISQALRGAQLPRYQGEDREIRILARLQEEDRKDITSLMTLEIPNDRGLRFTLDQFADIRENDGPSSITHWDKKPNFNLTVTGSSDRIDQLVAAITPKLEQLKREGYRYSFGDKFSRVFEDQGDFQFAMITAVVFVFLLMGVLFESFALPLTIIACIPYAWAGSMLMLKFYGMPANLFAYIGIVIIVGVVVNNGIVLVDLINRQRQKGMDRLQAISLAGYYRFRPILMTAGTTIFSLIPMAFGDTSLVGIPYNPLGMAMIGGLALNSMLTLLMVPVFYTLFDDLKKVWEWIANMVFPRPGQAGEGLAAGAKASSDK